MVQQRLDELFNIYTGGREMNKPEPLPERLTTAPFYYCPDSEMVFAEEDKEPKDIEVEIYRKGMGAYIAVLESLADQAARYIDTIVRPNETTQVLSASHLWARGLEINGEIRALMKPSLPLASEKQAEHEEEVSRPRLAQGQAGQGERD